MNIPEELKYTHDHEWVKIDGDIAIIGVTDFAQRELGDIVYVEMNEPDETVSTGDVIGSIEAVKTVSDVFSPLSGEVIAINELLEEDPELLNNDPYEGGWLAKIRISNSAEVEDLLDYSDYMEEIGI